MAERLTPKQARFVEEYKVDLNATQAAIRAGYSRKTAYSMGQRLLKNAEIQKAIKAAQDECARRTAITQDYVLKKLREIADQSASDAPYSNLKYANKLRALELLGKHLGVFDVKSGSTDAPENNIFEVIDQSTREEIGTNAIPEIEPQAELGDDVVE